MTYLTSLIIIATTLAYYDKMPFWVMCFMVVFIWICGLLDGALIMKRRMYRVRPLPIQREDC